MFKEDNQWLKRSIICDAGIIISLIAGIICKKVSEIKGTVQLEMLIIIIVVLCILLVCKIYCLLYRREEMCSRNIVRWSHFLQVIQVLITTYALFST
ncbi:hypothetical protein ACTQ6A_11325 [Lachnospiraceae bacterium LCP25S3_G4]